MAVVINNATKGIIFGFDENRHKTAIINLETHFNHQPFNVKLLDSNGVDIVASGNSFISDIVFKNTKNKDLHDFYKIKSDHYLLTPDYYKKTHNHETYKKRLLTNITTQELRLVNDFLKKDKMKTVDYYDPLNWALTHKMRGFTDLHCTFYPESHCLIDSITAFTISFNLKVETGEIDEMESDYEYDVEREGWRSSSDSEDLDSNDSTNGSETQISGSKQENSWSGIYDTDGGSSIDSDYEYFISSYIRKLKPAGVTPAQMKALRHISENCLYVEYSPTPDHIEVRKRDLPIHLQDQQVVDLYEKGSSQPYGTVIGVPTSLPLNAYALRRNEGIYHEGVNYYSNGQGLVLLGGENSKSMFYAKAVAENIYIPDVFYDKAKCPLDNSH